MTHLSLRAKSNKTDGNEALYEASYEAPLTRKTRLKLPYFEKRFDGKGMMMQNILKLEKASE